MARQGTYQIANTLSAETYKVFEEAFKADKKTDAKSISSWILEQAKMNIRRREYINENFPRYRVVSFAENIMTVEDTTNKKIIVVRLEKGQLKIESGIELNKTDNLVLMSFVLATPELMLLEKPEEKKN